MHSISTKISALLFFLLNSIFIHFSQMSLELLYLLYSAFYYVCVCILFLVGLFVVALWAENLTKQKKYYITSHVYNMYLTNKEP